AACGGGGSSAGGSAEGGNAGMAGEMVEPAPAGPVALPELALQQVASGLSSPLFLTSPPGDPRLFIVERTGGIRIVQDGALLPQPYLDLSEQTTTDGERGLLSMAFDPQYAI